MEKQIKRVRIEYEDGSSKFIEGAEAQRWLDGATTTAQISQLHGFPFPDINWVECPGRPYSYKLMLRRYGEDTNAELDVETNPLMIPNANAILSAVRKAVTEWIKTTEEGTKAWVYSGADLNVGDLSSYTDDENLRRELKHVGILSFEIHINDFELPDNWMYDTILANAAELEED